MWQPALYAQLARLSAPSATLATFTSVGEVRRGLQAVGFEMRKVKGYGRKREMLCGTLAGAGAAAWSAPWLARPGSPAGERSALIVGAGLAGCATALALARRGWQVTLIERHDRAAAEASGNTQGILYCKLSAHQTPLSRYVQASYAFGLRLLHQILPQGQDSWQACGVLQLCTDDRSTTAAGPCRTGLSESSCVWWMPTASTLAGVAVNRPGSSSRAGWVPHRVVRAMLQHGNIVCHHSEAMFCNTDGEMRH